MHTLLCRSLVDSCDSESVRHPRIPECACDFHQPIVILTWWPLLPGGHFSECRELFWKMMQVLPRSFFRVYFVGLWWKRKMYLVLVASSRPVDLKKWVEFAICFILSNSHSDIPNRYFKFLLFLGKYLRHKTSGLEVVVTHLFLFCFVFFVKLLPFTLA